MLPAWLRLKTPQPASELEEELKDYLSQEYQISKFEVVEESKGSKTKVKEVTVSFNLQMSFNVSEVDGEGPTWAAQEKLAEEMLSYLKADYTVKSLELLDDSPYCCLIDQWDDGKPTPKAAKSAKPNKPTRSSKRPR